MPRLPALLSIAVAPLVGACARKPAVPSLPLPLLAALMGDDGDGPASRFSVGELPPGYPAFIRRTSWAGDHGELRAMLLANISTDSVLAHYRRQLVAAGWATEGQSVVASGAGIQRFTFRQGDGKWSALLMIVSTTDRHAMTLSMTRTE